jgi:uncharacterized oxidoreductase
MCEMLAGALTGGGTSGPVGERGRIANGMLSFYVSPSISARRRSSRRQAAPMSTG